MRLKEIKPGMVIHCKNYEEKKALLEEAERLGYRWYSDGEYPTDADVYSGTTIHFYKPSIGCGYFHITWSGKTEGVTEFSDLIIPEPELSAEEALLAYDQMCRENYCCNDCPIYGILGHECAHKMDGHITEIVDVIKKWKADREKKEPETEKKEPEIEWVFKGVADIVGCNEIEFFVSDKAAMEWCERRTLETGNNHAYVPVCRVKAVE